MDDEVRTASGETSRLGVPVSVFAEGAAPPFVLFDRRGRVADVAIARTVYVAPSDIPTLDLLLAQRLPSLLASRRTAAAARAWALHRILMREAGRALRLVPEQPNALAPLVAVLRLAAEHVPGEPGPHLAELAQAEARLATHGVATAVYAMTLAAADGFDDRETLSALGLAGVFADTATQRMPSEVISRPGPLTPDEWEAIRLHSQQSAELLMHAGVRSATALRAIRSHHERWGGGGYPDGLVGTQIPLEARLLAIADTYAALTEDRPYRPALHGYEALLEMAQAARSSAQFEPRLLRAFVRVFGQALGNNASRTPAIAERDTGHHEAGAA